MSVKINEWKNNVGTQKMHMTLSRLKTGLEGINKYNIWLRSAEQEKKICLDFSFENVEILHEHKPFAQLC